MVKWQYTVDLVKTLANLGRDRDAPTLSYVEPLKIYHSRKGTINNKDLDKHDGKFTRREIISRYLLTNIVLDQGPDPVGIGRLLATVTEQLYRQEVRIFHKPIEFFKEFNLSIDEIWQRHESIKKSSVAKQWARNNESNIARYNLFFAQSPRGIIPNQILDYVVHRWGVPLCLFVLLEKDAEQKGVLSVQPFVDYLESTESAELMARNLKRNDRYGLGNAVGDKACHLFAKIYVDVFNLVKHRQGDKGWKSISYEPPLDSNAGRVLFRTGFLLEWASMKDYIENDVIQMNAIRKGIHYIRVTNIRGMKTYKIEKGSELYNDYNDIRINYLKIGTRPTQVEIQRIPSLVIYHLMKEGYNYTLADFDDGLMQIGTNYCYNHQHPKCQACPLKKLCIGYKEKKSLITRYTT